jgi:hypothetical protein
MYYIVIKLGVLVNLEGSQLSSARGDLVVPIVTTMSEVLGVNVPAMLIPVDTEVSDMQASTEGSDISPEGEGDTPEDSEKENYVS